MQPLQRITTTGTALWMILACGPLNQLQSLSQPRPVPATEAALIERGHYRLADAFVKLAMLPGYRLESETMVHPPAGQPLLSTLVIERDAAGNSHIFSQNSPDPPQEIYLIAGQTYLFDPQNQGWVDQGAVSPAEAQQFNTASLIGLSQADSLLRRLAQLNAVPQAAGHGAIQDRPATRYELQYAAADLAEVVGQIFTDASPHLSSLIWLDAETGAPLKLEISLYEAQASRPTQEFRLEVSHIGQIAPIAVPSPLVDPAAMIAATTTAQTWIILETAMDYQGQSFRFELVPVRVSQTSQADPLSAQMYLILRQLPAQLFLPANLEPFLTQLGQRLALSIPQRNTTIPSDRFHLEHSDAAQRTLEVLYFFQADLEDFAHVELVLSGQGNPAFAPVPVEDNQ